jgi:hypothetical protein
VESFVGKCIRMVRIIRGLMFKLIFFAGSNGAFYMLKYWKNQYRHIIFIPSANVLMPGIASSTFPAELSILYAVN